MVFGSRPGGLGDKLKIVVQFTEQGRLCTGLKGRRGQCQGNTAVLLIGECATEHVLIIRPKIEILRPLAEYKSASSEVDSVGKEESSRSRTVVYCCCNILKGKDLSCVKHGIVLTRRWVRCLVTMEDIGSLQKSDKRQIWKMMIGREGIRWINGKSWENGQRGRL